MLDGREHEGSGAMDRGVLLLLVVDEPPMGYDQGDGNKCESQRGPASRAGLVPESPPGQSAATRRRARPATATTQHARVASRGGRPALRRGRHLVHVAGARPPHRHERAGDRRAGPDVAPRPRGTRPPATPRRPSAARPRPAPRRGQPRSHPPARHRAPGARLPTRAEVRFPGVERDVLPHLAARDAARRPVQRHVARLRRARAAGELGQLGAAQPHPPCRVPSRRGQHAGDARFAELISALHDASEEFRSWWSTYEVRESFTGPLKVRVPGTGTIAFDVVELRVETDVTLTLSVHMPTRPTDSRKLATMARGTLVVDALP